MSELVISVGCQACSRGWTVTIRGARPTKIVCERCRDDAHITGSYTQTPVVEPKT